MRHVEGLRTTLGVSHHFPSCLGRGLLLFTVVYTRLAHLQNSRDSSVSTSRLTKELGLQTWTTMPSHNGLCGPQFKCFIQSSTQPQTR